MNSRQIAQSASWVLFTIQQIFEINARTRYNVEMRFVNKVEAIDGNPEEKNDAEINSHICTNWSRKRLKIFCGEASLQFAMRFPFAETDFMKGKRIVPRKI